ncbi:MAG: hypothetical protein RMZ41_012630 [Nostoc sp. DedVER02]|uniref:hypothetical protein n=1 Tax=unclassified Nostoc TaxID=2593658 RepID=UPI002AD3BB79|nr:MULTISPECIES: hypothetical protein [unclassified Nostoc]MDZ7987652.1 hypothetical protein [Nostoc sp. DedVER02]MDZ8114193.1 hypothetical protein [Nostoc sp. DedVER01b]
MNINLTEEDLSQMPSALRTQLLHWQMTKMSSIRQTSFQRYSSKPKESAKQLSLVLKPEYQAHESEGNNTRITLTQLYDAGITKQGMPIRVRLKRDRAKELCRSYINSMEISGRGTIIFQGQEFDLPSPLATEVNGSSVGGWEYIEIKKDAQWVRLEELRQIFKQTSIS